MPRRFIGVQMPRITVASNELGFQQREQRPDGRAGTTSVEELTCAPCRANQAIN